MISAERRLELVERATGGDQIALKVLLTDTHDRLCTQLSGRIPDVVRGTVDAEDVVQETFVEVFRHISTFTPRGPHSFDRWVLAIAVSRLRNAIKRQRAVRRGGGRTAKRGTAKKINDSTIALLDVLAGPGHTPSGCAVRAELVEAVHDALGQLPDHYRRALWLVHIEGQPVKRAADIMRRTERAVHGLCRRGMDLLRAQLQSASRFLPSDR